MSTDEPATDSPAPALVDKIMSVAFPPDYVDNPPATLYEGPEPYPAAIGVFCDDCRLRVVNDFVVSDDLDQEARFEIARAHLRGEGWSCTPDADLCPNCAPAKETS